MAMIYANCLPDSLAIGFQTACVCASIRRTNRRSAASHELVSRVTKRRHFPSRRARAHSVCHPHAAGRWSLFVCLTGWLADAFVCVCLLVYCTTIPAPHPCVIHARIKSQRTQNVMHHTTSTCDPGVGVGLARNSLCKQHRQFHRHLCLRLRVDATNPSAGRTGVRKPYGHIESICEERACLDHWKIIRAHGRWLTCPTKSARVRTHKHLPKKNKNTLAHICVPGRWRWLNVLSRARVLFTVWHPDGHKIVSPTPTAISFSSDSEFSRSLSPTPQCHFQYKSTAGWPLGDKQNQTWISSSDEPREPSAPRGRARA